MIWLKFLLVFLWPIAVTIGSNYNPRLIVRNVGQGLWVTVIEPHSCLHFDTGGELSPQSERSECQYKKNIHYLSHLDWDHISFLYRLKHRKLLCRMGLPLETKRKKPLSLYKEIPPCSVWYKNVVEIKFKPKKSNPNALSRIFTYKDWALLPGDSPKSMEKVWLKKLPESIRILILGHHGSHTSTSRELLSSMPKLILAIASARKKKYGHPHRSVKELLQEYGIPLLSTENWGNIILEVPKDR